MALLDVHGDDLIAAAEQAPTPLQRKEPTKRFSTWGMLSASPKGVAAGAAEATGSTADILGAFGQASALTNPTGGGMFATQSAEERKQSNEARDKILKDGIDYNSEAGRSFRNVSASYTPDAQTTHVAENAVFNVFRVGSKAITAASTLGVLPGAALAGAEEGFTQSDQLGQQGVDLATRSKVGAVTAAVNAVGFALPAAGKTWLQTGALALAGGPVSFMAQNAASREILKAADYTAQAEQFDPLDPVGLALSTVLPFGFGALAMRGAKVKGKVADLHPPAEVVDAARVNLIRENMDSANPVPHDLAAADAHAKAYTQAMEQQAAGERVNVADVAPTPDMVNAAKVLDEIDALQAERADLLGDAGSLAERGAIRKARDELNMMERQQPPASEADIKDLAKIIQEREGISYKTALTQAKKQTAGAVADFEARQARLNQAIEVNANAQKATQRIGEIDGRITELEAQKVSPIAKFQRDLIAATGPGSDFGQAMKKSLDDMSVELDKYKSKPAIAPMDTGQQAMNNIAPETTGAPKAQNPLAARIDEISFRNPQALDAPIHLQMDDQGKSTGTMTARDYLDMVKREAAQDSADADLLEIAANCFLSG